MQSRVSLRVFLFALLVSLLLFLPWEWYFSEVEPWPKGHDVGSKDLWADWRARVDDLDSRDVVILGSSRGHFDLNIHLWDSLTGRRPVMLAFPGSSPFHPVEDLVENSRFDGLLVISTAPGLFYTMRGSWGANEGKKLVDHYNGRTYAQKFNAILEQQIDPHFSFTQGDLRLKHLLERISLPDRESVRPPLVWPPMVTMDKFRNIRMIPEMETDTALQRQQTDIWFNPDPKNRYADSIPQVLGHYVELVRKFKERGGRVAFIRPPVTYYYLETETKLYPREAYWDRMLRECGSPGHHYQDDPETNAMIPPEWSHLNRRDSDRYTEIIVAFLQKHGLL